MVLKLLSTLIGYTYTILWGLGFWPPVITNYKLKSIQGLSIDFLYFNFIGYVFYTTYFSVMLFNPYIRKEFSDRYTLPTDPEPRLPLVKSNDFIFALHGLSLNLLTLSQAYWPWNFKKNDNQVLSNFAKSSIAIMAVIISSLAAYIIKTKDELSFQWLDLFTSLGLFKILMSLFKNYVQLVYNYKRKSTHGWPILMIYLDTCGGSLSLLQLALDAYISHDFTAMFKNLPKLLLSVEAVIADIIFFLQHYYWYAGNDPTEHGILDGIKADEEFLHEHEHDHDHIKEIVEEGYGAVESSSQGQSQSQNQNQRLICSIKSTDEGELQRLII